MIKISRSFSRKKMIAQYEPIDVFCAIEAEVKDEEITEAMTTMFQICVKKVEEDIKSYQSTSLLADLEGRLKSLKTESQSAERDFRIELIKSEINLLKK